MTPYLSSSTNAINLSGPGPGDYAWARVSFVRKGLRSNPPPQFGQTCLSSFSTQSAQKVHSYEQINASLESGGRCLLQCSQFGFSSSIGFDISAYFIKCKQERYIMLAQEGVVIIFANAPD